MSTSIRNRLLGTIEEIVSDKVVSEIVINTAAGPVTSIITTGSVKRMNLKKGRRRLCHNQGDRSIRGDPMNSDGAAEKTVRETDMKRQNTVRALAAAFALLVLNVTIAGATDATDDINPEDFTVKIDNPFFPLPPGITFIYKGLRN